MGYPAKDLTGQIFGEWTVFHRAPANGRRAVFWYCRCSCGTEKDVLARTLVAGTSTACLKCGWRNGGRSRVTHGETSGDKQTRLYKIWAGILSRTTTDSATNSYRYKGRGIVVDRDSWPDFVAFREWALASGYRDDLEIDRIDNDGNYTPTNCHWVTHKENTNNRPGCVFLTAFGETKTATQWAEDPRSRVSAQTMSNRKRRGWNEWDAMCVPSKKEVRYA
jgi:hypothetical protein